jgi:hypothetical protein
MAPAPLWRVVPIENPLSLGKEVADKDGGEMQTRGIAIFSILVVAQGWIYHFDKNRILCPGGYCQGVIQLSLVGKT